MTLKEQFEDILRITNKLWNKIDAGSCEEIADDFAIGFAQWFHENCYEDNVGYYRAEELLETYKKEKEL